MMWVETYPRDRPGVFGFETVEQRLAMVRSADLPPAIHGALMVLAGLMAPEAGRESELAAACQAIATWAELNGAHATRLAFAQACALLLPDDAKRALMVARVARDLGEIARAESWFRHTVRLSRNRDVESYGWAYIGLGVLFMRAGNASGAQATMLRAIRHANRNHLREIAAVSHHHMFHLATEAGRLREAYKHAQTALICYGETPLGLRGLAADVGRFWIHLREFKRALPVLEAAAEGYPEPNIRAMVTAVIAQAAAGAGDRAKYEMARRSAEQLVLEMSARPRMAETYLHLAYADLSLGEWESAEIAAQKAVDLAVAHGEREALIAGEAVCVQARQRQGGGTTATICEDVNVAQVGERLASELFQALLQAHK
jgi:tetratricopeptide (TPR) repeat protein